MIGIILSLDIKWPSLIGSFIDFQNEASSFSNFGYAVECIILGKNAELLVDGMLFYLKLILYYFLPFIMMLIFILYWVLHSLARRNFK
jgi:hypothetical protein